MYFYLLNTNLFLKFGYHVIILREIAKEVKERKNNFKIVVLVADFFF